MFLSTTSILLNCLIRIFLVAFLAISNKFVILDLTAKLNLCKMISLRRRKYLQNSNCTVMLEDKISKLLAQNQKLRTYTIY